MKREWIVLFVPNGWEHVQGGDYVEPLEDDVFGKVFDNRLMSVAFLRSLWRAHRTDLASLPLTNREALRKFVPFLKTFQQEWDREMSLPGKEKLNFIQIRRLVEGEDANLAEDAKDADVLLNWDFKKYKMDTLEDLIRFGVAFRDLSGMVVLELVKELEKVESRKILIVVDQFNAWGAKSAYEYEYKPVMGSEILVPKALSYLHKKKAEGEKRKLANGLFVCAESSKHPEGLKELFKSASNSVPLTIEVPHYSQVEFLSSVLYYAHQQCIPRDRSIQDILAYRMLVNSNPRLTRIDNCTFFMRLAMEEIPEDYMLAEGDPMASSYQDMDGSQEEDDGYDA